jgi:hypothetical protein
VIQGTFGVIQGTFGVIQGTFGVIHPAIIRRSRIFGRRDQQTESRLLGLGI